MPYCKLLISLSLVALMAVPARAQEQTSQTPSAPAAGVGVAVANRKRSDGATAEHAGVERLDFSHSVWHNDGHNARSGAGSLSNSQLDSARGLFGFERQRRCP